MFKEFAMKGSLVDIAVAFAMGAALKKVVTSFKECAPIEVSLNAEGMVVYESAILWRRF